MDIIWTISIGFLAGVIAKLILLGWNEPAGFVLTTILGIIGALVAAVLGQAVGWYRVGEGAGLIGAVVGAMVGPRSTTPPFETSSSATPHGAASPYGEQNGERV
jgi:uncharacterized membrane protein YeaQ/YmgE (transglycosylase-associated protein family)